MNCFCTLNFEAFVAEPAFFSGHLGSRVKLWTLVCFEVTTAAAAPAFVADHINLNSCLRRTKTAMSQSGR